MVSLAPSQLEASKPSPPLPSDSMRSERGNIATSDDRKQTSFIAPSKKSPRLPSEVGIHLPNGCYRATSNKVVHYQDICSYREVKGKASPSSHLERIERAAHSPWLDANHGSPQGASLSWLSTLFSRRKHVEKKNTRHSFGVDTTTRTTTIIDDARNNEPTRGKNGFEVDTIAFHANMMIDGDDTITRCHGCNGNVMTSTNNTMIGTNNTMIGTNETMIGTNNTMIGNNDIIIHGRVDDGDMSIDADNHGDLDTMIDEGRNGDADTMIDGNGDGGGRLRWEPPRSSSWEQLSPWEKPMSTTKSKLSLSSSSSSPSPSPSLYTNHSPLHVDQYQGSHNEAENPRLPKTVEDEPPCKPWHMTRKAALFHKFWSLSQDALAYLQLHQNPNTNLHNHSPSPNPDPNLNRNLGRNLNPQPDQNPNLNRNLGSNLNPDHDRNPQPNQNPNKNPDSSRSDQNPNHKLNPSYKFNLNHNHSLNHRNAKEEAIAYTMASSSTSVPVPSLSGSKRSSDHYHQICNNYYYSSAYYNTIFNCSSSSSSSSSSLPLSSSSSSSSSSSAASCVPGASKPNTPRTGTGTSRPTTPRAGTDQGLLRLYLAPNVFTFRARNRHTSRHRRCLSQT